MQRINKTSRHVVYIPRISAKRADEYRSDKNYFLTSLSVITHHFFAFNFQDIKGQRQKEIDQITLTSYNRSFYAALLHFITQIDSIKYM